MTVELSVKNEGTTATRGSVQLSVHDPNAKRVRGKSWLRQQFSAGQTRVFTDKFALQGTAAQGKYTVGVAIQSHYSNNQVATFTVQSAAPKSASPTATQEPVPQIVEPTATPEPPAPTPTPEPVVEQPAIEPVLNTPIGQTIQQMVDAALPGSVVSVPAGVYNETVFVTKPLVLVAQPGAVIDGGDRAFWIVAAAHDVTIDGFEMRGGKNWEYWGGITNSHNDVHYDRLTVQNNILHDASYAGIATKLGTGHRILNNIVYNNGALGIRVDSGSGHLVSGNQMYNNNPAFAYSSGWDAGGIKVSGNYGGVQDMVIELNVAYNNNGPGIWVDVDGNNITIRHNIVHHNSRSGITYELSTNGTIHDNRVWENGYGYQEWGWGAGILVQNSSHTSVFNNTVAWNADGIAVISQNRGTERWNNVTGVSVSNNTIAQVHDGGGNTYGLAWLQDWSGVLTNANSNNRGSGNVYWLNTADGADLRFRWGDSAFWKLSDFMASPGENDARYLSADEKNERLAAAGIPGSR